MSAATYIDQHKNVFTCKFSLIEKFGCPKDLLQRLKYTKVSTQALTKYINFQVMVERLMARPLNSNPNMLNNNNNGQVASSTATPFRPTT